MNFYSGQQNIAKPLLIIAFLVFFFVGLLGLSHFSMINPYWQMTNCPLMGMPVLCQMNPLQHIAAWQSVFTALPNHNNVLATLLLLLTFAFGIFAGYFYRNTDLVGTLQSGPRFIYQKKFLTFVSSLQEAFSSGILHPKIF